MIHDGSYEGSRPDPDPTVRTIDELRREIDASNKLKDADLRAIHAELEHIYKELDTRAADIRIQVGHLESLHDEKFRSIQTQFIERDTRTEQTSRDSKVAVDAALQAAKEAVGKQQESNQISIDKSEGNFTKQIDQLNELWRATTKAQDDKISDLKGERSISNGRYTGQSAAIGWAVGGGGVLVAIITIILHLATEPAAPTIVKCVAGTVGC